MDAMLTPCLENALRATVRTATHAHSVNETPFTSTSDSIRNFRDAFSAILDDVQHIVLQEVSGLEDLVCEVRAERDSLIRDRAEAQGLVKPRHGKNDSRSDSKESYPSTVQESTRRTTHSLTKVHKAQSDHTAVSAHSAIERVAPKHHTVHAENGRRPQRVPTFNAARKNILQQARSKARMATSAAFGKAISDASARSSQRTESGIRRHSTSSRQSQGHGFGRSVSPSASSQLVDLSHRRAQSDSPTPTSRAEVLARSRQRHDTNNSVISTSNSGQRELLRAKAEAAVAQLQKSQRRVQSNDRTSDESPERETHNAGESSCASSVAGDAQCRRHTRSESRKGTHCSESPIPETHEPPELPSTNGCRILSSACSGAVGQTATLPANDVSTEQRTPTSDTIEPPDSIAVSPPTDSQKMSQWRSPPTDSQKMSQWRKSMVSNVTANSAGSFVPHAEPQSVREPDLLNFELLPMWLERLLEAPAGPTMSSRTRARMSGRISVGNTHNFEAAMSSLMSMNSDPSASCCDQFLLRNCILPPTSLICIVWEMVSLIMIAYDYVTLPLQVFWNGSNSAYHIKEYPITVVMEWFQRIFWTISIPYCMVVGFVYADGKVEMRPAQIRRHYLSTWFCFDMIVVLSDWLDVILEGFQFLGALRLVKTLRLSRFLRMVRIARAVQLPKFMEDLDTRIFSEKIIILIGILKISFQFVSLGHLVACAWYGVGKVSADDIGEGWISHYEVKHESVGYRYLTSLHWAMCNFIGSMDIQPQTLGERLFANIMLLLSFVVTAWFVSSITAKLTRLQIIAGGRDGQFATLRQFLLHRKITTKLAMRVVRSAQQTLDAQSRAISEKDVDLLSCVTEQLRAEIHYEQYFGTLSRHALFKHLDDLNHKIVRELCHTAIGELSIHEGEFLFAAGDVPDDACMLFFLSGFLSYTYEEASLPVLEGMWACEPVLWVRWVHLGDMKAHRPVTLIALSADLFRQSLTKNSKEAYVVSNYAKRFVEFFNRQWDAVRDVNMEMDTEDWMTEAVAQIQLPGDNKRRSSGYMGLRRSSLTGISSMLSSSKAVQPAPEVNLAELSNIATANS